MKELEDNESIRITFKGKNTNKEIVLPLDELMNIESLLSIAKEKNLKP